MSFRRESEYREVKTIVLDQLQFKGQPYVIHGFDKCCRAVGNNEKKGDQKITVVKRVYLANNSLHCSKTI